jgi:hypothetical protein
MVETLTLISVHSTTKLQYNIKQSFVITIYSTRTTEEMYGRYKKISVHNLILQMK